MAESSTTVHESGLRPETLDRHRAIVSLMEELEAVDWYDQRVEASTDAELREILAHNRDEEKEHAAMVLEWLRRRDSVLDGYLKTYLFTEGPIRDPEHDAEHEAASAAAGPAEKGGTLGAAEGCLGIGSLRSVSRS